MNNQFQTEPFVKRVDKPWGYEIIFTPANLDRTGKVLFLRGGKKFSLQYHDQKEESLYLFSGEALIWLENNQGEVKKIPMEQGKGYLIIPGQKHRVEAKKDCFIFEVSSPERGTTYRIEDDYQRRNETEADREKR